MARQRRRATVLVLRHPDDAQGDLDGYAFANKAHADEWMAQPLGKHGYTVVEVTASRDQNPCPCCGAIHWWMKWRSRRKKVEGAWQPPKLEDKLNYIVDDGEE
jgi:hypothetical protein